MILRHVSKQVSIILLSYGNSEIGRINFYYLICLRRLLESSHKLKGKELFSFIREQRVPLLLMLKKNLLVKSIYSEYLIININILYIESTFKHFLALYNFNDRVTNIKSNFIQKLD